MTDLAAAVEAVLPGVRADLERLVRIPSVSADPTRAAEVVRSAELVATLLRDAGVPDVQILTSAGGAPAVVGRIPAPAGAPTVLLYAHHDVQPTGDRADWDSDPFEPQERQGRLYGRGAADDKAGVLAHVAALRAFGGSPPVGVTVFVEGEEEIGSPTLATILAAHRDLLVADVLVIADSVNWGVETPALTTSLRGLVDCVVEVRTLHHGVHSGMYGGAAIDALSALCRLLATLHDDRGDVAVAELTATSAAPVDYPEERFRAEGGVPEGVSLVGTGSLPDRLWTRPAVSIIGLDAPRVADAANVLVPSARAEVSLRIAPGDDPERAMDALVRHLEAHAPWGAQVKVTRGSRAAPVELTATGPAYDAARDAFRHAFGAEPVDVGIGGSIPFIAELAAAYPQAAVLVTGVEDPDSRAHGADESLHLEQFAKVCLAETLLLQRLAAMRR